MITIAFANQKGGVGKTTTAVTLGHALARHGLKTVIIDTDPQGHVALSLGSQKTSGLYRWIVDEFTFDEVSIQVRDNLWIVPGDKRTENAKRYLISMDFREAVLQSRIYEIDQRVDAILIDMAPSLDVLHVAALVACDWMIIPTRLDHLAVDGVSEVLRTFAELMQRGSQIQGYSIIPTFFERTTNETTLQLEKLVQTFKANVLPPIPSDTKARESSAFGQTLWEYAPGSPAVAGYKNGSGTIGGYQQVFDRLMEIWGL